MLDPITAPLRTSPIGATPDIGVTPRAAAPAASAEAPVDFGSFLAQMVADTANTLKTGEATALAGINGQVPTHKVVEAVMTTEQTLQSAIAIRDKVVAAFLELSHMQI